jgi:hypothetical protein
MEKNKIKLKYIMNLWKSLPGYPTKEDIIYELSVYLVKDGRPNGSFSIQTLNGPFGLNWEETKIKERVEEMIKDEDFVIDDKKISPKTWYKIKNNPYYN